MKHARSERTNRFAVRWRGYDRDEVDAILDLEDPRDLLDRAKELAAEVVAEAHRRADAVEANAAQAESHWDELGRQIAAILASAQVEAEGLVVAARAEADQMLAAAADEATQLHDLAQADLAYAQARARAADHALAEARRTAERAEADRQRDADAHVQRLVQTTLASHHDELGSLREHLARAGTALDTLVAMLEGQRSVADVRARPDAVRPRSIIHVRPLGATGSAPSPSS